MCSGKKLKPVLYTKQNENVGKIFVKRIQKCIELVWSSEMKSMVMTEEDKIDFNNATKCWICEKVLTEGHERVRDHCHCSGKFRGAAHQKCNSSFRKPKFVPISFHNLSGYDAHLFVKSLRNENGGKIDCIPNNEEKYISFSKSIYDDEKKRLFKIRFVDS